jgi:hypothetical protein
MPGGFIWYNARNMTGVQSAEKARKHDIQTRNSIEENMYR